MKKITNVLFLGIFSFVLVSQNVCAQRTFETHEPDTTQSGFALIKRGVRAAFGASDVLTMSERKELRNLGKRIAMVVGAIGVLLVIPGSYFLCKTRKKSANQTASTRPTPPPKPEHIKVTKPLPTPPTKGSARQCSTL